VKIKDNILNIIGIFCVLLAPNMSFASKKQKKQGIERWNIELLPDEILANILKYTDPETTEKLLYTTEQLRVLSTPQLFDQLVRAYIDEQDVLMPLSLLDIFSKMRQNQPLHENRNIARILRRLTHLYAEKIEGKVSMDEGRFMEDYKKAFVRNIDYFINSQIFFKSILFQEDINQKKELIAYLQESFGINIIDTNLDTIRITTAKVGGKERISFLLVDSIAQVNNMTVQEKLLNVIQNIKTKMRIVVRKLNIEDVNQIKITQEPRMFLSMVNRSNQSLLSIICYSKLDEHLVDNGLLDQCLENNVSWHSDIDDYNPLHNAVSFDNTNKDNILKVLQKLRSHDTLFLSNINKVNKDKQTPLLLFLHNVVLTELEREKIGEILEFLLKNHADPNLYQTLNPLYYVLDQKVIGSSHLVLMPLLRGKSMVTVQTRNDILREWEGGEDRRNVILSALLQNGANPNGILIQEWNTILGFLLSYLFFENRVNKLKQQFGIDYSFNYYQQISLLL
jgi:hypothetical protein